jgi:hypothetical protein
VYLFQGIFSSCRDADIFSRLFQWLICFEMVVLATLLNLNFPAEEFANWPGGKDVSGSYGTFGADGGKQQPLGAIDTGASV